MSSGTNADYGRAFAALRHGAGTAWPAYTDHSFVRGLGDGTLPRAAFLHYLIQDYVFLVHFARAWALGVVKAETLDEMRTCAGTVNALVNHEMGLHVQVCAAEGISEDQLFHATEEVENLAYTRYVMDAGLSGDFIELMAAMAPCVMGYGEIGLALAGSDGPYKGWIDTYAVTEYQQVCRDVGAMLDAACIRRIGAGFEDTPRWSAVQARFTRATALEVGFWDMGMRGGATSQ
ncbi:thiaminase II [Puniceibacterium sp. IMCC21224]|uniref:thiaminase II n=1 Tax=Puniceibacterium sp. IMCC21224 TaxID=1618204 RepID=UPI00064DD363|nr:thiaminase II [Puniceibacterium sp. IMCC21224]KMK66194.1 thiaminase II [Puniceibacterium sp. IMCC21224]